MSAFIDSLRRSEVRLESDTSSVEHDFGRLVSGHAQALALPQSATEVATLIRLANEHGGRVTGRGGGLSQSGQSVADDSVTCDLGALDAVVVERDHVRCGPGATFRAVMEACAREGRTPESVPLNLDLSVGGVLSAGGFGSSSHRRGLIVSSVAALDVVLGSGEVVHCDVGDDSANRDPSDIGGAVLGGFGQYGLITGAKLRTRPAPSAVRTHYLLYDDYETFIRDQSVLSKRVDHLEGFCAPAIQGLRLGPGGRRGFARWFYGLHVGVEGTTHNDSELFSGLSPYERLGSDVTKPAEHAARYDLRFAAMRATGGWAQAHPWVEAFIPESALEIVPEILGRLPLFLGGGHRLGLIDLRDRPSLLAVPEAERVYAFAIVPMGVPEALREPALAALQGVHDELMRAGAKRYVSGWLFDPTRDFWAQHYGSVLPKVEAAKARFDPRKVLCSRLCSR